jgi:hypothetical protein
MHTALHSDNPAIGNGEKAPHLVDLTIIAGDFAHQEAVQGTTSGNDTEDFECFQLQVIECWTYVDVKNGAHYKREQEQRAHKGNVQFIHKVILVYSVHNIYVAQHFEKALVWSQ